MDTNCTMNHEIVPKAIDWLRPAQNVSAHHKEIINMQNMQNTQICKTCIWALQEERASSGPSCNRYAAHLLLLPFLLDGLLAYEVLEHNRLHPLNPALDPSSELIGITLIFIHWYNLYSRRYQPKDEVDIQDLTTMGDRCNIFCISCILNILCIL
jgi:hypothetical protein